MADLEDFEYILETSGGMPLSEADSEDVRNHTDLEDDVEAYHALEEELQNYADEVVEDNEFEFDEDIPSYEIEIGEASASIYPVVHGLTWISPPSDEVLEDFRNKTGQQISEGEDVYYEQLISKFMDDKATQMDDVGWAYINHPQDMLSETFDSVHLFSEYFSSFLDKGEDESGTESTKDESMVDRALDSTDNYHDYFAWQNLASVPLELGQDMLEGEREKVVLYDRSVRQADFIWNRRNENEDINVYVGGAHAKHITERLEELDSRDADDLTTNLGLTGLKDATVYGCMSGAFALSLLTAFDNPENLVALENAVNTGALAYSGSKFYGGTKNLKKANEHFFERI